MPNDRVVRPSTILGQASPPLLHGMTPAVYGLLLPETRALVRRLWAARPDVLYEQAYDDVQDVAHGVFLDAWCSWVTPLVRGLEGFSHRYVTNGSSEAIRESIWTFVGHARSFGLTPHLHVFAGEYEGYAAYARAAGAKVIVHEGRSWDDARSYMPNAIHRWYVSQPSAIDGNSWPDFPRFVTAMTGRNIEVAVDLAYVGAASEQPSIDVGAPNISHVFFSLSKVFGVFYHRVGGVLSRAQMLGLEGNKWFKNIFSLYLGISLIRESPMPLTLPSKYRSIQAEACRQLREEHGIPLVASEVILLASSPLGRYPQAFRRGDGYRWCLTPTMDWLLRQSSGDAGGDDA